MRPGLLAAGIILLILGAMGYFLMDGADGNEIETTADTESTSVRTETYATIDDEKNETNETNTTGSRFGTASDRITTSDRTTTDVISSEFETTADTNEEGVPVAYVYLDEQGNMYDEDGQFLGSGISSSDTRSTVSDTYGTGAQTGTRQTVSENTAQRDTGVQSDTTDGVYDQSAGTDANRQTVTDSDAVTTDTDRETGSQAAGGVFTDDTETTASTTAAAGGFDWLRALSILAMVVGALLTILGLVLPNRDDVAVHDRHSRTTGTSGRRVYEREEEHRK